MAQLPTDNIIRTSGSYDLNNLIPGREYLLTLRGTATEATLAFNDGPGGGFSQIQDGSLLGNKPPEARLIAPSSTLRITVSGLSGNLRVNLIAVL